MIFIISCEKMVFQKKRQLFFTVEFALGQGAEIKKTEINRFLDLINIVTRQQYI